jgi:hypothetical protein
MPTLRLNSRATLFWAIIILTVGMVIAFGLPYGPIDWMEKAWAQDVYSTFAGASQSNILLAPEVSGLEAFQNEGIISGREDSNDDGIVDAEDNVLFFRYDEESDMFVPIELSDLGITDILASEFTADGNGVVAAQLDDGSTAVYIRQADGGFLRVGDLPPLNSPVIKLGSLFIVNNNNTNNPPTLYVVDNATGTITATRDLEYPNTVISFDPQADFMLASTFTSQLLRIYNLASIDSEPLSFQFEGNLATAPQWSPTGGKLFYTEEALNNRAESMTVIDTIAGDQQTFIIPDYADNLNLIGAWSTTGRYITLFGVNEGDDSLTDQPLTILDTVDGVVLALENTGASFVPVAWSSDDTYLLYLTSNPGSGSPPTVQLYVAASLGSGTIQLSGREVLAVAWHPTELKLALLVSQATDSSEDSYEVMSFDAVDYTLSTVTELEIIPFDTVSLLWLNDAELALAMTYDDLILEDEYNVTLRIDTATGERTELIPASLKLD